MLLLTLVVVIALVVWALRLMDQALKCQEFSFMLAGFLVASSAVAMMTVYFLMSDYMVYMDKEAQAYSELSFYPDDASYALVQPTSYSSH